MRLFFISQTLRRFAGLAVGAILCSPEFAQAADRYPQKFDLICKGTGRQVFQPYPPMHGLGLAHAKGPWPVAEHFIVDLTIMHFCEDLVCSGGGHRKLAKMDNDRIFFLDEIGLHQSVDLGTLKYVMQVEQDEGIIEASRATCRFAPFSGFPFVPTTYDDVLKMEKQKKK